MVSDIIVIHKYSNDCIQYSHTIFVAFADHCMQFIVVGTDSHPDVCEELKLSVCEKGRTTGQ